MSIGAATPTDSTEFDEVAAVLREQDLTILDKVTIPAVPAGSATRRATPQDVQIEVPLADGEDAVVLLEQDGVYSWQFPTHPATTATRGAGRTRSAAPAGPREARFHLRVASPGAVPASGARTTRRGILTDFVVGAGRAIIFKFAGRFLLGRATTFLERHVQPGIVVMQGRDPLAWPLVRDFGELTLPPDRPPRILLFVHGTFSTTKGGYGGLCATPWGLSFLEMAHARYDAVVGFDHPTLSVDPRANATELLRALEARTWNQPVEIDVICHSRGAITLRSLTEHLLPAVSLPIRFKRVIFVGGVNAGTLLAAPENWRVLIDLYTNLAVAATRGMALFPSAVFASGLLRELLKSVGALAKSLVETGVNENAIPGLAAMNPTGPFITEINRSQAGQPAAADAAYYAITSDFEAKLALGQPGGLPAQLIQAAADGFMDRLMQGADNDLVVNTDSMTAIDRHSGTFIKDTLAFGTNGIVHHTNYFLQPKAVAALAHWLDLPVRDMPGGADSAMTRVRRGVRSGTAVGAPAGPARIHAKPLVLPATMPAADAAAKVIAAKAQYVVIERTAGTTRYRYALRANEILAAAKAKPGAGLAEALNLHEDGASREAAPDKLPGHVTSRGPSVPSSRDRVVVVSGNKVVGVVEKKEEPQSMAELVDLAREQSPTASKSMDQGERGRRGARPWEPGPGSARPRRASVARPTSAQPPPAPSPAPSAPADAEPSTALPMWRSRSARARSPEGPAPAAAPGPLVTPPQAAALPPGAGVRRGKPTGGSPASGGGKATCHFLAEVDEQVEVEKTVSVDVRISREELAAVRGAVARTSAAVAEDRLLIVEMIPKQNFRNAGETARVEVPVPAPGEPLEPIVFDVTATHVGPGEIWIRIRQGSQSLATLKLACTIVKKIKGAPQRKAADAEAEPLAETPPPLHQLMIHEIRRGADLLYWFALDSQALQWKDTYESKPFSGERQTYIASLYKKIEDAWLSVKADFVKFDLRLKAQGAELCRELFPSELHDELWAKRDSIESILVFSEEPFIPWESVYLHDRQNRTTPGARFLAEMGLIRWQHGLKGYPPNVLHARPGRCHFVIPHYQLDGMKLQQAQQEAVFLTKRFSAKRVVPNFEDVTKVLADPASFDLLHFACHGDADSADILNAELLLEGRVEDGKYVYDELNSSDVGQLANFKTSGARPIVVLNACRASRQGYKLTSIGGFAREFLGVGAGMFVGALWSVGDHPARTFTETLYARLLASDTLAEATIAARKAAKDAGEGTWLAYTVYGNPHARLKTSGEGN